jgi:molybdopterin-binding protein
VIQWNITRALHGRQRISSERATMMHISARNRLKGVIKEITLGNIMAEIVVQLPTGEEVVALITFTSSERLNLQIGDEVVAVFKSTDVMIGKEE